MRVLESCWGKAVLMVLASGLAFCEVVADVEFAGGTGEPNDPYQIATVAQLLSIGSSADLRGKHYVLIASLDLSGRMLTEAPMPSFAGTFDGAGYVVRNLRIEGEAAGGLFRSIAGGAEVRNLGVVNVQIVGGSICGGLASSNSGHLVNCYTTGAVISAVAKVIESPGRPSGRWGGNLEPRCQNTGGLVASNHGTVTECYSTAAVLGDEYVGGLVGTNGGTVSSCHSTGEVTGDIDVGGLVGFNVGYVTSSYCLGCVAGETRAVGGLVGSNNQGRITSSFAAATVVCQGDQVGGLTGHTGLRGSVSSCYARGSVTGADLVGGLVGSSGGTLTMSYTVATVTGTGQNVGALAGSHYFEGPVTAGYFLDPADGGGPDNEVGIPLTDVQMRQQASFVGFDFWGTAADGQGDLWFMPPDGYPLLAWQAGDSGLEAVPDVSGMSPEEATAALEAAGFVAGEVSYDFHRTIPAGCVIRADPHTLALPGATIDLIVSLEGSYDWADNPGDGTGANPYQIATPGQLESLADHPELMDKWFVLVADLDMAARVYENTLIAPNPVRGKSFVGVPFTGRFDGQGHTIHNLTIRPVDVHESSDYMGLFGMIEQGGRVEDLHFVSADITGAGGGSGHVGVLAGYSNGVVKDCSATGLIRGGDVLESDGLIGYSRVLPSNCLVDVTWLM
ncbi:MAG: PASTA domain-containing protein [Sedimentisphaerales bacterium]|nr:PASTA domain-containing protein [Sedimentisphaerales bacterium]